MWLVAPLVLAAAQQRTLVHGVLGPVVPGGVVAVPGVLFVNPDDWVTWPLAKKHSLAGRIECTTGFDSSYTLGTCHDSAQKMDLNQQILFRYFVGQFF